MHISDIISPKRICCQVPAASKKRVFELISDSFAQESLDPGNRHEIFDCLVARERLGSTSLGNGVAIPHARMSNVKQAEGVFISLKTGVDFDAPDGVPVDLVFALLVPENHTDEHLKILATLAAAFSDGDYRDRLRCCRSEKIMISLLTKPPVDGQ